MTLGVMLVVLAMGTLIACGKKDVGMPYGAILANNDDMAYGVTQALKDDSRKIPIIGVDASDKGKEAVGNGTMAGTVKQQADVMAQSLVDIIVEYFNNKDEKEYGIDTYKAYKNTEYSKGDYVDKDLDVGDTAYNYTAKDGVVRVPYLPYGSGSSRSLKNTKDVDEDKKIKDEYKNIGITFFVFEAGNDWMTAVENEFKSYATSVGLTKEANFQYAGAKGTGEDNQNSQFDTAAIGENKDFFVMNPQDAGKTSSFVTKAKTAGIPIIFNNKQDTTGSGYDYAGNNTVYVGSDLDGGGMMQGTMLADMIKTGGKFAIQHSDNTAVDIRVLILFGEPGHADATYRTLTWIIAAKKALEDTGINIVFDKKIDVKMMPNGKNWSAEGAQAVIDGLTVSPGFKFYEN